MYTFHLFDIIERKYSKQITKHLRKQKDFKECNDLEIYYWSDKNSKSILQDYYPFPKRSIIEKKYLYILFPSITIPSFFSGSIDKFIKNDSENIVYYLKPSGRYIGGMGKDIIISNDPYYLYDILKGNKNVSYIIQKEIIPKLINGYKYDIRVYALIVYNNYISYVYIYPGILRLCKEKYKNGSIDVNKQITVTGDFILMENINKEIKYFIYLTLLNIKPQKNKVGYQYLGYDIIEDINGKYHLIEINVQPCLERIKYSIINEFSKKVARPITTNQGYEPFMSSTYDINLSELNLSHLDSLYRITKNIDVMKFIGNLKPWTYEKTKRFIEYENNEDYYIQSIILNKKLIGIIGRHTKDKLMIFLDPKYTGKGIGKKALHLFISIVQCPLYADVLKNNNKSIRFFKNYSKIEKENIFRFIIC